MLWLSSRTPPPVDQAGGWALHAGPRRVTAARFVSHPRDSLPPRSDRRLRQPAPAPARVVHSPDGLRRFTLALLDTSLMPREGLVLFLSGSLRREELKRDLAGELREGVGEPELGSVVAVERHLPHGVAHAVQGGHLGGEEDDLLVELPDAAHHLPGGF